MSETLRHATVIAARCAKVRASDGFHRRSTRTISKGGEVSIVAVVAGATVDRGNPSPVTIIMVVVVIPIVVAVIAVSVVTPMIVIGRRPSR